MPVPLPALALLVFAGWYAASRKSEPEAVTPPRLGSSTLRFGSTGRDVEAWQSFLGLAPSGSFDTATVNATKKWQASHGLEADGIVGPKSLAVASGRAPPSLPSQARPAPSPAPLPKPSPDLPPAGPPPPPPDEPPPPAAGTMSGRALVATWGEAAGRKREERILDCVARGLYVVPTWHAVTGTRNGRSITCWAMGDAFMVGTTEGVRVNVNAVTAQVIADRLGLFVPTSRMEDMVARTTGYPVHPQTQVADAHMADTSRMLKHSDAVEAAAARAGLGPRTLRSSVGKSWVTSERLLTVTGEPARVAGLAAAVNYGWHSDAAGYTGPGGMKVYQPLGMAHAVDHTDYSQTLRLFAAECVLDDGTKMRCEDVLRSPELAFLLSDEVAPGTACRVTRHPAVPRDFA